MTSAPADVALAFARESLGWDDVRHSPTGVACVFSQRSPVSKRLMYADLNAVVGAARKWCDRQDAAIEVGYYGYLPGEWEVTVTTHESSESVTASDLCHALLAACVEASRKLKDAE